MNPGKSMVLPGSIIGSAVLVVILLMITSGFSYPAQALSETNEKTTPGTDNQVVENPNPENSPDCGVSGNFPPEILQWCELITHNANLHGLDPNLIAALITQESGGNPGAYSHSGAVGLMQVMPRDGIAAQFMCVNGPCFSSRPSIAELEDPDFNVAFGTKMLAGLISRNGNIREGLKAYGPMDVGYYYSDKVLNIYEQNR
jgi:soluble lytic murein transglycosylase-like protein